MNKQEKECYDKIVAMLPFQAVWALEYNYDKQKYKLQKNRAEKQRVKDRMEKA